MQFAYKNENGGNEPIFVKLLIINLNLLIMKQEQLADYTGRWINEEHKIDLEIRDDDYRVKLYQLGEQRDLLTYYLQYFDDELPLAGDQIPNEYVLFHKNGKLTLIHFQNRSEKKQHPLYIPMKKIM